MNSYNDVYCSAECERCRCETTLQRSGKCTHTQQMQPNQMNKKEHGQNESMPISLEFCPNGWRIFRESDRQYQQLRGVSSIGTFLDCVKLMDSTE